MMQHLQHVHRVCHKTDILASVLQRRLYLLTDCPEILSVFAFRPPTEHRSATRCGKRIQCTDNKCVIHTYNVRLHFSIILGPPGRWQGTNTSHHPATVYNGLDMRRAVTIIERLQMFTLQRTVSGFNL